MNKNELKKELEKIINNIKEDELRQFVIKAIMNDDNFYDLVRRKFINYFPRLTYKEYEEKIYDAIYDCGDKDGFITYSNAKYYSRAMYEFTQEAADQVRNKNYDTAFDIVEIILNSIPNTPIDDSNGSTGDVAYKCIEITKSIVELCNDNKVLKRILDYYLNEAENEYLSNYGIESYEIFEYYIKKKLFLDEIQTTLEKILDKKKDHKYFWNKKYYLEYLSQIKSLK